MRLEPGKKPASAADVQGMRHAPTALTVLAAVAVASTGARRRSTVDEPPRIPGRGARRYHDAWPVEETVRVIAAGNTHPAPAGMPHRSVLSCGGTTKTGAGCTRAPGPDGYCFQHRVVA